MRKSVFFLLFCVIGATVSAKVYTVESPDGKIVATVDVGDTLRWHVDADGRQILAPSAMALNLGKLRPGIKAKVKKVKTETLEREIPTPVYKRSVVKDECRQLSIEFSDGYTLQVRAYDDGAAYRFVTNFKKPYTVYDEVVEYNFPGNYTAYVPYVNDNRSGERYTYSFESYYDVQPLNDMYPDSLAVTPILVDLGHHKAAVSDFGAVDYPGMFLKNAGKTDNLTAEFAPVPLEGVLSGFNELNFIPTKRASYIAADLPGRFEMPWRGVVITRDDAALANTDMAVKLAQPSRIADTSWIQPGKVAWDWWNNLHITGVDFKVGRNTPTYKYFIDFAYDNLLPYIIVDEGWSDANSLMKTVGDIDIPEIVAYGKKKGVGVILWASWKNVHRELEQAMKHYADMGVAGFKIDFFDADDQNMMRDMRLFAEEAAKHHLVLDYHGVKANGLQVTYPNILNYEGVKGLENYRWSSTENNPPLYAVTIPYIRTIVGPMDYTPGAMLNVNAEEHRADGNNPMSEGTRAHQVAMYVVYDAPLQMLADSPTRYNANKECLQMISAIPTVFDETIILDGRVGEYIVTARRSGDSWYVGAMTNRDARDLELKFDFLPDGTYEMEYITDGMNCDIDATDHRHKDMKINPESTMKIPLYRAGGFAAIITPQRKR